MAEADKPLMTFSSGGYKTDVMFTLRCERRQAVRDDGSIIAWPQLNLVFECAPEDRVEAQRVVSFLAKSMNEWGPVPSFEWREPA